MAAFYSGLVFLFYSSIASVRRDRSLMLLVLLGIRSEIEKVVYWMPEILFAAEITFCGLDGCMPQQKLNLLQFTATVVA